MKKLSLYTAGALLAISTVPANAAIQFGDQIKAGWRLPTESSPFAFSISPSPIFAVGKDIEAQAQLNTIRFLVDFGKDSLAFTFLTGGVFSTNPFNGIYFDALTGEGFGEIASVSGIAAERIHDMGLALSVNFSGLRLKSGDKILISFAPGVPEPASWAMLVAGFGAIGTMLRRRSLQQRIAFS